MMTNLILPHSRLHILVGFVLYLPVFIASIFYSIEGMLTYLSVAVAVTSTVLAFTMGKYNIIRPTGPYGVGYQEFVIEQEDRSISACRFYPIDKQIYEDDK